MTSPLLASGLATALLAAQAPSTPAADASSQSSAATPELEEVIVTAQKRPENSQTVPVSVVAFTEQELNQLGMREGFDLANQVPNMNIDAPTADSNVRYFIRGVGTQDFNTLATSPIALYIDDVYVGTTIANSVNLYDMQRVEVLLGPQGTLWEGTPPAGPLISFLPMRRRLLQRLPPLVMELTASVLPKAWRMCRSPRRSRYAWPSRTPAVTPGFRTRRPTDRTTSMRSIRSAGASPRHGRRALK